MSETSYNQDEASHIDSLPAEEQTKDEQVDFSIPEDATHDPNTITEVAYNPFGLFVIFEGDGRQIKVSSIPVGMPSPREAADASSQHANEVEKLYGLLEGLGVALPDCR